MVFLEKIRKNDIPDGQRGRLQKRASLFSLSKGVLLQEFFCNSLVQWTLIGALIVNIASWILIAYFVRPVDFPIILHYNVYFGVDMIGIWWFAYALPLVGTVIIIANLILAHIFFLRKERAVSHVLMLAAIMANAGVLVASATIALINY